MTPRRNALLLVALLLAACSRITPTLPSSSLPLSTLPAAPSATPSHQPSPTPTLAPPESLTLAELHQRLDPFNTALPDCALPCYNGLLVGRSSLQEALNFYARLGIGITDLIPGDYEGIQDGSGRLGAWLLTASDAAQAAQAGMMPPLVDLYLESNVVQSVYVGWRYIPSYLTPARVLGVLGQPTHLDLALVFGEGPPAVMLRFLYPQVQAGFAFYTDASSSGDGWRVCFSTDQVGRAFLGIFAPDIPPMAGLTYSDRLLPLLETVGMTYEDFAAEMASTGCLNIPAERAAAWQALPNP